jgi:hypothetical protein
MRRALKRTKSAIPCPTEEIKSLSRLVKGANVFQIARHEDPSSISPISTMKNRDVVILEIQPSFDTVALPKHALQ